MSTHSPEDLADFIKSVPLTKRATELPKAAAEALLGELKKEPPPPPMPTDKHARDMSEAERREWLAEHKRRFDR